MAAPTSVQKLRGQAHDARTQDNVGAVVNPMARSVGMTPIMGAPPPSWIRPDYAADFVNLALRETAYHRDALGYTWLKLAASTAAGVAANSAIATLAQGYRPSEVLGLVGFNGTTFAVNPFAVSTAGVITTLVAIAAGESLVAYQQFLAVT